MFPLLAGLPTGATSDLGMACDRARVLLHSEERPRNSVAGKVGFHISSSASRALPCAHSLWHCPAFAVGQQVAPHVFPQSALLTTGMFVLKFKKSVMVVETPSAVCHYSEGLSDETGTSGETDAIFRAAKKALLTLMKLTVSAWL